MAGEHINVFTTVRCLPCVHGGQGRDRIGSRTELGIGRNKLYEPASLPAPAHVSVIEVSLLPNLHRSTKSGQIFQIWSHFPHMEKSSKSGQIFQIWAHFPHMEKSSRYGQIFQIWSSAVSPRYGQIFQIWTNLPLLDLSRFGRFVHIWKEN